MFDLNFDEIIFPENPIKIVQNKDTYLTPYKIGQLYVSFQSKLTSRSLSLSFLFSFFNQRGLFSGELIISRFFFFLIYLRFFFFF